MGCSLVYLETASSPDRRTHPYGEADLQCDMQEHNAVQQNEMGMWLASQNVVSEYGLELLKVTKGIAQMTGRVFLSDLA